MLYFRREKDCPDFDQFKEHLDLELSTLEPEEQEVSNDPSENYKQRIKSATEAFNYACDAIAAQNPVKDNDRYGSLKDRAKKLEAYYLRPKKNADHALLIQYLEHLEYLLSKQPPKELAGASPAKWIAKADEYVVLIKPKPPLVTVTKLDGVGEKELYLVQVEKPQTPMTDRLFQEFLKTRDDDETKRPDWYRALAAYEKILFDKAIRDILDKDEEGTELEKLKRNIQAISSRLRTIPGLPNFSIHQAFIVDKDGGLVHKLPADLRSSVVSSRDHKDPDIRKKFTHENIALILTNAIERHDFNKDKKDVTDEQINDYFKQTPILLQTLISPQLPSAWKPDSDLNADKNDAIDEFATKGITLNCFGREVQIPAENLKFYNTNHPLNLMRHGAPTTTSDDPQLGSSTRTPTSMEKLYADAETQLNPAAKTQPNAAENTVEHNRFLSVALKTLKDVQSISPSRVNSFIDKNNHRELYLAALEMLLVWSMDGIAHSTCVSGKDRRGILAIFKDSIAVYVQQYPELNKKHLNPGMLDDDNFKKIFASIYKSGHHQANAGQNAPGAAGIKTADMYLPNQLVEAVGEDRIEQDNRLAGTNEFDKLLAKQPNMSMRNTLYGAGTGFFAGLLLGVVLLAVAFLLGYFSVITVGIIPLLITIGIGSAVTTALWTTVGALLGNELQSTQNSNLFDKIEEVANDPDNQLKTIIQALSSLSLDKTAKEKEVVTESEHEVFCNWITAEYGIVLVEDEFPVMLQALRDNHNIAIDGLKDRMNTSNEPNKEQWLRMLNQQESSSSEVNTVESSATMAPR